MRIVNVIFAILLISALVLLPLISLYGDLLWFNSLGYGSVFWTMLSTKMIIGIAAALFLFVFIYLNLKYTKKKKGKRSLKPFIIIVGFIALITGIAFSSTWETVLKFNNVSTFGLTDPVFNADISFYTFVLPFYNFIVDYLLVVVFFSIVFTILSYITQSKLFVVEKTMPEKISVVPTYGATIKPRFGKLKINRSHLSFLGGIFLLILAVKLFLQRYDIMFSERGVLFGASYTDLNITLPLILIYSVAAAITAIAFFANIKWNINPMRILAVFVALLIVGGIAGFAVQKFIVEPNEFNIEKPYIENNINYTLKAYKLDDLNEVIFPVTYDLTSEDIESNKQTIDNIRLWDYRPLLTTYNQLQIFRTYYDFNDIDIDRYNIDGKYRQVMLSARELDQESLQPKADTWVNRHLVYTHGYGLAMSPVNMISAEGLPELYIKDIPPKSDYFDIGRPEIYYGEKTNDFVVVQTTTDEFDYPKGDENIYISHNGTGGIQLDSLSRLIYAVKFNSIELLISSSIKPESMILLYRNIAEREDKIAPFLHYDRDPYLVVSDGRLYWIHDAYTVTSRYPYSEPIAEDINYIRNSVKVVTDAYNGDVTYYVIEDEPVINTYRMIFPDLFKDFSEMPENLKKHIRYPEDLFTAQTKIYSTYHMSDPRVFYNKEDQWITPDEIYSGSKQKMIPYYVIMKLPENDKEEFILMIPFTPKGKINMIGWMAALSDQPDYGKLVVYSFSKQELIYGPMQIEARIDQDTEISQKITLWSQVGSRVIRGNTLVIPIKESILYVEPLYLQASEEAVPELKRVIVAFGDRLTMQESLDEALNVIFKPGTVPEPGEEKTTKELIAEAEEHYKNSQDALKAGDWVLYGDEIKKLGEILEKLAEQ